MHIFTQLLIIQNMQTCGKKKKGEGVGMNLYSADGKQIQVGRGDLCDCHPIIENSIAEIFNQVRKKVPLWLVTLIVPFALSIFAGQWATYQKITETEISINKRIAELDKRISINEIIRNGKRKKIAASHGAGVARVDRCNL